MPTKSEEWVGGNERQDLSFDFSRHNVGVRHANKLVAFHRFAHVWNSFLAVGLSLHAVRPLLPGLLKLIGKMEGGKGSDRELLLTPFPESRVKMDMVIGAPDRDRDQPAFEHHLCADQTMREEGDPAHSNLGQP